MHLNVVDFPAPFNPKSPKHSPLSKQKLKFFIASLPFFLLQQQNVLYKGDIYSFCRFFILIS